MDLLENSKKKNEKTPMQKVVLILLIISIIMCITVGIAMVFVSMQTSEGTYEISINGESKDLSKLQLLADENGKNYIPIKVICNELGYNYYNGEFKVAEEDKNKGYIEDGTNVVQFFANSEKIYKTSEGANIDYQYYQLDNKILVSQDNLYIAVEDLDVALNLILIYSEKNNGVSIVTPEYWITKNESVFENNQIKISDSAENKKALAYGYVIVNKDNKYGVVNLNGEELIGNKYSSITFTEYTMQFIVSNTNNQFGIISKEGLAEVNLQYDSLEILNYNPLLYKVKKSQKYGVINENGSVINDIIYDSIGYPSNKEREINYTLVIPNINENIPESIVVCSNGKYGLVNLENGKIFLECTLNGIYSATSEGITYYIIETSEYKVFLEDYINNLNRVTVNLD